MQILSILLGLWPIIQKLFAIFAKLPPAQAQEVAMAFQPVASGIVDIQTELATIDGSHLTAHPEAFNADGLPAVITAVQQTITAVLALIAAVKALLGTAPAPAPIHTPPPAGTVPTL